MLFFGSHRKTVRQILPFTLFLAFVLGACSNGDDSASDDDVADELNVDLSQDMIPSVQYVSDSGNFSLMFPGGSTPQEQTVPIPTDIGAIDMNMVLVDADDHALMAAYSDYPEELLEQKDTRALLNDSRDGAVRNVNGELRKERDYEFQGYPAKEFYVKGTQGGAGMYIRANIILANSRLYQVLFMAFDSTALDSKEAEEYISSFKIQEPSDS